jgi:transcriptional regulator GlxA family with amidase domain
MLETADLSIEAIANEAGYEDTSFFGRLFRRETGMTPAHYRLRFSSLRRALKQT